MDWATTTEQAARSVDCVINPRSVAIIGASNDPVRIGGRSIRYMMQQNFGGAIMPVNPNRSTVQGLPAYASIADLPQTPDVAIIAVPSHLVRETVEQLVARRVKGAILFSAGFGEIGPVGQALQTEILDIAKAGGLRLVGPNCLGVWNARSGFYGTFTSTMENGLPPPGRVGIASQSGAYASHLFTIARARRIGMPIGVTTGNEADVSIADAIAWMVDDPDTDVIAAYAEGFNDPDLLVEALGAARRARKPVVMLKVGRSALGQATARSHTASIAGNDKVVDTVINDLGVFRARDTDQLLDVAYLATRRIYPVRNTLGMLTVSGGAGVLASDVAEELGLALPPLPEESQAKLKALIPYAGVHNPVDCTAQALNDMSLITKFGDIMVADGGYTSILAYFSTVGGTPTLAPQLSAELGKVRDRYPDRLYVLCVLAAPELLAAYEAQGFAVLEDASRAVIAIDAMGRFGRAFDRPDRTPAPEIAAVALPASPPNEADAKTFLQQIGIDCAPEQVCADAETAVAAAERIGFPVVMKIVSPDILHKSEIGGVLLDIGSAVAVRNGDALLRERARTAAPSARLDGILVARQLSGGVECVVGIHRDPVFGPIAMVGLGGIFVETLGDVALHRCPFGVDIAETMIRSLRTAPLLLGARGRPPADVAALATMLARLSVFADQAGPRLQSIDLNPVLVLPAGQGAVALDAVIDLSEQNS